MTPGGEIDHQDKVKDIFQSVKDESTKATLYYKSNKWLDESQGTIDEQESYLEDGSYMFNSERNN